MIRMIRVFRGSALESQVALLITPAAL